MQRDSLLSIYFGCFATEKKMHPNRQRSYAMAMGTVNGWFSNRIASLLRFGFVGIGGAGRLDTMAPFL